jgi:sulfopyruvate decarboxylase subunit beta
MMDKYECLRKLAQRRDQEVIISTMSVAEPWESVSNTSLDFASANSAMGHAADFAYGIALAQPQRRIITLNGDGSMLMCLGTMVTIAHKLPTNYVLVIIDNGSYEVTGSQPLPSVGSYDFAAIARGAGIEKVYTISSMDTFDEMLPSLFEEPGPLVFIWKVARADELPPDLHPSIKQRVWRLRNALLD